MRAAVLAGLALVGCAGDTTTDGGPTELTACEGAGAPSVEVGQGSRDDFVPYGEGDDLEITQDGAGQYGFSLDLLTEGLDTTEAMTTVVRLTLGNDPSDDFIASLVLQCPDEGPGWTSVFAALDETLQDETAAMALVGQPIEVSATLTDQSGEAGSTALDLFVAWPAR